MRADVAALEARPYIELVFREMRSPPTVYDSSKDAPLLAQIKASDIEAFRILYEHYQPILFRQILFHTRDTDAAHDIVQETFIRVWEHRKRLDPSLSFPAYISRISGNLVRDESRRRKRRERLDADITPPESSDQEDPLHTLEATILDEELSAVISDLPDKCRTVFLLSRIEGKSNRDIADMLGTSVRTVEHQISHALDVIRKNISNYLQHP